MKDDILQQHAATKKDRDLQDLVRNPLPKLTEAFIRGLIQKSENRPVIVILDTFEKAAADIDHWLCGHLLTENDLSHHKIRIVVAGRHRLSQTEAWRKFKQDRQLLYEWQLERFDQEQTASYLQRVGITQPDEIADIYRATKGLPYYLNWIREQREKNPDNPIDFSEGSDEIAKLLLQGLEGTHKQIVQLAACCRWFDQALIRRLVERQTLEAQTDNLPQHNYFEWLKQQDFVQLVQGRYRLDDVARDAFRQSLRQDDQPRFQQVHSMLADYFQSLADREVPSDSPDVVKYESPDWRQYTAEFLYYLLFSHRGDRQTILLSHLFVSRYFNRDEVVTTPFTAITAEVDLDTTTEEPSLLSNGTRRFLSTIRPVVEYSQIVFGENRLNEFIQSVVNDYQSQETIDKARLSQALLDLFRANTQEAIDYCFNQIPSLNGLAKFAALLYKSQHGTQKQRLDTLRQAKIEAERVSTASYPEFSSGLFVWDVGNTLSKLGSYEEAVASYDKALELRPDHADTWNVRGVALAYGGRYDEAMLSYDESLKFGPTLPGAWYNKACTYALQGMVDHAVENLQRAIELGSPTVQQDAKTDSDFDRIRQDERFQALVSMESSQGHTESGN